MTFDAKQAVLGLYRRHQSWRQVAREIGSHSAGYWCAVAHGRLIPSRRAENALRRYLGLAPRGVERIADMPLAELRWRLAHRVPAEASRVEASFA